MQKKKTLIALLVLALLVLALALLWIMSRPEASGGDKSITLTVIHGDGSEKEFTLRTDLATLGAALTEEGLITGNDGQFGLYVTTVDGETADEGASQWWRFADAEGNMLPTGIDMTNIADGDAYRVTLETGYDSFG